MLFSHFLNYFCLKFLRKKKQFKCQNSKIISDFHFYSPNKKKDFWVCIIAFPLHIFPLNFCVLVRSINNPMDEIWPRNGFVRLALLVFRSLKVLPLCVQRLLWVFRSWWRMCVCESITSETKTEGKPDLYHPPVECKEANSVHQCSSTALEKWL